MFDSLFFEEIIQSPELRYAQSQAALLLKDSIWWVLNGEGRRKPLGDHPIYCPESQKTPELAATCEQNTCKQLKRLEATGKPEYQDCCSGYLRYLIPFYYRSKLIGAMGVCHFTGGEESQARAAISLFERYVGLYTTILSEYDDLESIHDIWQQMVSSPSLSDLLPRILHETLGSLNLDRGVLYLVDDDGKLVPRVSTVELNGTVDYQYLLMEGREYQQRCQKSSTFTLSLSDEDPLSRWTNRNLRAPDNPGTPQDWKDWNYLAIPFWRKGRLLGILVTQTPRETAPVIRDERILSIITDGASAVLEHAINVDRIQQRSLALSTIHTIHRIMSSCSTPEDLLNKIARLALQVLRAERCSVMMKDPSHQLLNPVARIGLRENEVGTFPLCSGHYIPGMVLESCEPLIVHYPYADQRFAQDSPQAYPDKSYLSVPLIDDDILGVITVSGRAEPFSPADREILLTLAEQAVIARGNVRLIEQQQQMVLSSLRSIANVVEMRDPFSKGHTDRVEELATRMGHQLSDDPRWVMNLRYAALLHDSGKIGVQQERLLRAASSANKEELAQLMQEHPLISVQIAQSMHLSRDTQDMIRHHHENYDGSGSPMGLKGEQIPLGARILSLVDAYVTLEQKGQPQKPYSRDQILAILQKMAGRKFDPKLLDILRQIVAE